MQPMYEGIISRPESPQVLDAEGPLDGELQWEYQQDRCGPLPESWSMRVRTGSEPHERESHEHESESVGWSPVSASGDDAVSNPRDGPGSRMQGS